jgi:hypothetical protein
VDAAGADNNTALHEASRFNILTNVKVLLENHANPNLKNRYAPGRLEGSVSEREIPAFPFGPLASYDRHPRRPRRSQGKMPAELTTDEAIRKTIESWTYTPPPEPPSPSPSPSPAPSKKPSKKAGKESGGTKAAMAKKTPDKKKADQKPSSAEKKKAAAGAKAAAKGSAKAKGSGKPNATASSAGAKAKKTSPSKAKAAAAAKGKAAGKKAAQKGPAQRGSEDALSSSSSPSPEPEETRTKVRKRDAEDVAHGRVLVCLLCLSLTYSLTSSHARTLLLTDFLAPVDNAPAHG